MNLCEIQARFDRVAAGYEAHDALEREVGQRLLQRLDFVRLPVGRALDLGCGTGRHAKALRSRFGDAEVVCLDLSPLMLRQAVEGGTALSDLRPVQGDLCRLPLAARSFDLVFCNLALQWAADFGLALAEMRRVLRPEGMLLFSVPGSASLWGLRGRLAPGAGAEMPIYMPELHEVGDLLVSTGFNEPVMDSEMITLSYPSGKALCSELAVTGAAGFVEFALGAVQNDPYEVDFEIVYGTAFGAPEGRPVRSGGGEVVTFSVDHLRRG